MTKIFSVSHNTEYDLAEGKAINNVYVRVYSSMFTSGLVAKMGANRFTTLMALANYMDENGECYPTQLQLADAIGVHKNTINKYINELLDFRIEGKPLVTRTKVNKGQGKISSYYKIHPLSQVAKFGGKVEEIDNHNNEDQPDTNISDSLITNVNHNQLGRNNNQPNNNQFNNNNSEELKITNSSTAIKYFQAIYREVYNVNYTVSNYGRDGKLMKDKVLTPYPELAKEIIEVAVRKYDEMFANPRYPRPSISMFSWAVNQLIPVIEEERKLTEVAEQAEALEDEAERKAMEKLAKLNGGII